MPREITMDYGSRLYAHPQIQGLDKTTNTKISTKVKEVCEIARMGNDWKEKLVNTAILVAAAVVGLVIGGHLLAASASASGAVLLSLGGVLAMYAIYSSVKTVLKILSRKEIEGVHDDAIHLRIQDVVEADQNAQNGQQFQWSGAPRPAPFNGGRAPFGQPYAHNVGAFRFG